MTIGGDDNANIKIRRCLCEDVVDSVTVPGMFDLSEKLSFGETFGTI